MTEQLSSTGNVSKFDSASVCLEFVPWNGIYWLISFVAFLSSSGRFSDTTSKQAILGYSDLPSNYLFTSRPTIPRCIQTKKQKTNKQTKNKQTRSVHFSSMFLMDRSVHKFARFYVKSRSLFQNATVHMATILVFFQKNNPRNFEVSRSNTGQTCLSNFWVRITYGYKYGSTAPRSAVSNLLIATGPPVIF
jgi:hypothetical protein